MAVENFGQLEQIFIDTIRETKATNKLNISSFFTRIEDEFVKLGFRDPARGGGWLKKFY